MDRTEAAPRDEGDRVELAIDVFELEGEEGWFWCLTDMDGTQATQCYGPYKAEGVARVQAESALESALDSPEKRAKDEN